MDFLIHHMLQTSASRFPDREALVDKDKRLTFQAAAKQVAGLAEGLRQAGIRRGDRVGDLSRNFGLAGAVNLWRIPGRRCFCSNQRPSLPRTR